MRINNKAGGCASDQFGFTKSEASPKTRFFSHWFFHSVLIAAVGAIGSVAQAQSCAMYEGAGSKWFSSIVAAAQSALPNYYCLAGYCATDFSVDVSTCSSAGNWGCDFYYYKIDAPGSDYCEQAPAGYCGLQGPATSGLGGLVGSGPCQALAGRWGQQRDLLRQLRRRPDKPRSRKCLQKGRGRRQCHRRKSD
jgi:hypothetical protein